MRKQLVIFQIYLYLHVAKVTFILKDKVRMKVAVEGASEDYQQLRWMIFMETEFKENQMMELMLSTLNKRGLEYQRESEAKVSLLNISNA